MSLRPAYLIVQACLMMTLFAIGAAEARSQMGDTGPSKNVSADSLQEAHDLIQFWHSRHQQIIALDQLAEKATPLFPNLAREIYSQALEVARQGDSTRASHIVKTLRRQSAASQRGLSEDIESLADSLEGTAWAAWPLRHLADKVWGLDNNIAVQAWSLGLSRYRQNPAASGREPDLAGLALIMARRDPAQARNFLAELKDPQIRAWAWRQLYFISREPGDIEKALRAGERIGEIRKRILSQAHTAAALYSQEPKESLKVFHYIFERLAGVTQEKFPSSLGFEVAAVLAMKDPREGLRIINRLKGASGAGFWAMFQAGRHLVGLDPQLAKQILSSALVPAGKFSLLAQRNRATCLTARAMATLDLDEARRMLSSIPPGGHPLRDSCQAALVLVRASRDAQGAWLEAGEIKNYWLRLDTCSRLVLLRWKSNSSAAKILAEQAWQQAILNVRQGRTLPEAFWRMALLTQEPAMVVKLAGEQREALRCAETLILMAEWYLESQDKIWAQRCLAGALRTIKSLDSKQMLDKVRLLGDMGRGWFAIDVGRARRFFEQAAEATRNIGETLPVPASKPPLESGIIGKEERLCLRLR